MMRTMEWIMDRVVAAIVVVVVVAVAAVAIIQAMLDTLSLPCGDHVAAAVAATEWIMDRRCAVATTAVAVLSVVETVGEAFADAAVDVGAAVVVDVATIEVVASETETKASIAKATRFVPGWFII